MEAIWDLIKGKLVFREIRKVERLADAVKLLFATQNLKSAAAILMVIAELIFSLTFDTPLTPRGQKINLDEWELVWSDEFEGDTLDTTVWSPSQEGGRRGGFWNMSQVFVENGNLIIRTDYLENGKYGPGWYSAGIETKESHLHKYGYWECRCICSPGAGQWSAFWTFADGVGNVDGTGRDGAEIDIFEAPNYADEKVFMRNAVSHNIHYDGYVDGEHKDNYFGFYKVNNPYTEFNTYGMEWNEDEIIFYINGVETDRVSGDCVPQVAEWIILSTEVAGLHTIPGLSGEGEIDPGSDGIITDNGMDFVSDFVIDYVRIYEPAK